MAAIIYWKSCCQVEETLNLVGCDLIINHTLHSVYHVLGTVLNNLKFLMFTLLTALE